MDRYPVASELLPTAELLANVSDLLAAMAVVNASVDLHLLAAPPTMSPTATYAGLTIATFTGYVTKTVTVASFSLHQTESDGSVRAQSTSLVTWQGPSAGGPTTVYGYAMTEAGGTTRLYRVQSFAAPVTLADDTQFLPVIPSITWDAGRTRN